jgi:superfamily II DNA or RNA helicase
MLRYFELDPDKAYVSNNLLLPKSCINETIVKAALTFQLNEEEPLLDEAGIQIGVQPTTMKMWNETTHHLVVPREFLRPSQYPDFRCEFVMLPRPVFQKAGIVDRIALRDDDQVKAYEALLNNDCGTLNIACGKGKSVIALKLAAALNVSTIIVVNTTALLEQWKEEIGRHLQVSSIGTVQGPLYDWQHGIVLAMVHTLSSKSWPLVFRKRFGLAIYDEAHHVSAPTFVKSADLFYGRRFSLTATATRTDGLEVIYQYHLGRVIHSNLEQQLIPHTFFHVLQWDMPIRDKKLVQDKYGEVNTSRVRTYLGRLDWRNQVIYQQLLLDLQAGRKILVLSHSVSHVQALYQYVSAVGAGMIIGETLQGDRMGILRVCNPVIGTFQLAREGLNKPELDTLYIVTPFGNPNDLQQAWGRIQREYPNKRQPIVRVFEDTAFSYCRKSCNSLRAILRDFNYPYERVNTYGEENAGT